MTSTAVPPRPKEQHGAEGEIDTHAEDEFVRRRTVDHLLNQEAVDLRAFARPL